MNGEHSEFVRVMFVQPYEHLVAEGHKLIYRAGYFYHVAREHVDHYLAQKVAVLESDLAKDALEQDVAATADKAKSE